MQQQRHIHHHKYKGKEKGKLFPPHPPRSSHSSFSFSSLAFAAHLLNCYNLPHFNAFSSFSIAAFPLLLSLCIHPFPFLFHSRLPFFPFPLLSFPALLLSQFLLAPLACSRVCIRFSRTSSASLPLCLCLPLLSHSSLPPPARCVLSKEHCICMFATCILG